MAPFRQYLMHPFSPHARRRKDEAKFQRAQREKEMAEATLRSHIPGADFEEPKPRDSKSEVRPQDKTHGSKSRRKGSHTSTNDTLCRSPTPSMDEDSSEELPVLVDQEAKWARQATKDDVYWNSTLIQVLLPPRFREDGNPLTYPYWTSRGGNSSLEQIGQSPKPLTAAQCAELEDLRAIEKRVLGAKEKESLSKAAMKQKSRKGKERAVEPDELKLESRKGKDKAVELDEPEDYYTVQGEYQQHELHVGMVHLPDSKPVVHNSDCAAAGGSAEPSSAMSIGGSSSWEPLTPALSMNFDPFAPLPVDNPILVYRNRRGQRRMVLPHNQVQPRGETTSQISNAPEETSFCRFLSVSSRTIPEVPTHSSSWNATLNRILTHESIDPGTIERVRQRGLESTKFNGGNQNDTVSAAEVGLVPNFSRPSVAAEWSDRWYAERRFQEQNQEWLQSAYQPPLAFTSPSVHSLLQHLENVCRQTVEADDGETEEPMVNGVIDSPRRSINSSISSRMNSGLTVICPSGATIDDGADLSCLEHLHSPTASANTMLRDQEKTLAIQEKLIRKLRKKVGKLERKADYYEEELIPELATAVVSAKTLTDMYDNAVKVLSNENDELWKLVDLSKTFLNLCWEREDAVEKMVLHLMERKAQRRRVRALFRVKKSKEEGRSAKTSTRRMVKTRSKQTARSRTISVGTSYTSSGAGSRFDENVSARDGARRPARSLKSNLAIAFSSSKSDLEALLDVMKRNMKVLLEDLDDWADMEQRCLELRDERGVVDERNV